MLLQQRVFGAPSLDVAKENLRKLLPKDANGNLWPLSTPLSTFDAFGEGISAFMNAVPKLGSLFFFLFLLSLSNLTENVAGGKLAAKANPYNIASIGNAGAMTPSYGLMEFVISFFMVRHLPATFQWE